MIDIMPVVSELHRTYCTATGLDVALNMGRIHQWQVWQARGWGKDELSLVLASLKRKVKEGKKWASALSFTRVVRDTDVFEEELAEAKALARRPTRCYGKDQVLRATGRALGEGERNTAKPVRDILAETKALADLKAFRESL